MYLPLISTQTIGFFVHIHAHLALVGPPHWCSLSHPLASHTVFFPTILPTHIHISHILFPSPPTPYIAPLPSTLDATYNDIHLSAQYKNQKSDPASRGNIDGVCLSEPGYLM